MPSYYMIVTNEIDYEWDIDNGFSCAGFPTRNKEALKRMNVGDGIVYYVTKHSKFMAISEVTGDYFYSEDQIWDDPYDLWPHRISTKPVLFIERFDNGVYIKDIWDDLEFIKNKVRWGSQVQGSFRKLTEHDFNVIKKQIQKKQETNKFPASY